MKKKLTAIVTSSVLTFSLLVPAFSYKAEAADKENWNIERYGDELDISAELNEKSQDEEFQKEAKQKIKESAKNIHLDEEEASASESADSHFTYDGGTKVFLDRNLAFKEFTLRSVGENVEIWVANDLSFPEGDPRPAHVVTQEQVDKLTEEFDSNIYPKTTAFFGNPDKLDGSSSPLPEMVGLPEGYYEGSDKVIMLVDNVEDDNYHDPDYPFFVAGFFWQTLENYIDRNIVTIDTNNWEERLESTFFSTTMHELQHLIHADNDGDETTWLNEGMSTFSEYLGGYGHDAGSINFLLDHPENSLVNWDEHVGAETGPETIADYGLVYLFTLYNYEQFGQEFIREVATSPLNGIESYNAAYKEFGFKEDFQSVFEKFVTALLIDEKQNIKGKKGIYGFETIDLRELPVEDGKERGMTVNFEKAQEYEKDGVPAWGADYKILDFDSKIESISFEGINFKGVPWETVTDPLDSDNEVYWGGEGDEADHNLIFKADLSEVSEATLQFDNYVDIEEQWDFGAVQVTTDGQEWTSLSNENTRSDVVEEGHPKIKENVPGFTGHYDDWQQETFDLTDYAGQEVYISFRYLTDWGHNDAGWFVDNIEVPEIGLSYDGTSLDGFQSKQELLEQYVNYSVTFVNEDKHGKYKVEHIDPFNMTQTDELKLKNLFKKGTNYMTTWYAAPSGDNSPVPFEYNVELKEKGKEKNKDKGKKGKGNKNK
ncbi:immune inhibitor A domain-containing protein [Sediminibacillus massiliensis]|uniref:immune inhibitor A domain-containing protein n=1 Tax=Sediminibacillus massiliensis TaxID=1926277 RepID=UPI0009885CA1|nr:immune inhibitor A domain-containing protein [Sediminibacillus massiliensis]